MSQALNLLTFEPVDDIGRVVSRPAWTSSAAVDTAHDSEVKLTGILGLVRAVQSELQRKALGPAAGTWHAAGRPRRACDGCGLALDGGALGGHSSAAASTTVVITNSRAAAAGASSAGLLDAKLSQYKFRGIRRPCGRPGGNEVAHHDLVGGPDAPLPAEIETRSDGSNRVPAQLRAAAEQFARVHPTSATVEWGPPRHRWTRWRSPL